MSKLFISFMFLFVLIVSNASLADNRSIIVEGVIRPTLDQFFWYGKSPSGQDMIRRGYNTAWTLSDYHKSVAQEEERQQAQEAVRRKIDEENRAREIQASR